MQDKQTATFLLYNENRLAKRTGENKFAFPLDRAVSLGEIFKGDDGENYEVVSIGEKVAMPVKIGGRLKFIQQREVIVRNNTPKTSLEDYPSYIDMNPENDGYLFDL